MSQPTTASKIRVESRAPTGKVYLGIQYAFNKTTGVGLVATIPTTPSGAGETSAYEIDSGNGSNGLHVDQYQLDAAVAGEGGVVTYWQS